MYFGSSTGKESFNIPSNSVNIPHSSQQNIDKKKLEPLETIDNSIKNIAKLLKIENYNSNLLNKRISNLNNKNLSVVVEKVNFIIKTEKLNSLDKSDDGLEDVLNDLDMFLFETPEKNLNHFDDDLGVFFNENDENMSYTADGFFNEIEDTVTNRKEETLSLIEENLIKLDLIETNKNERLRSITNIKSNENIIKESKSKKQEEEEHINGQETKTSENIQKNTEASEKTFADLHIESFASITKILKEKHIESSPNALKSKFDSIFLTNKIQTQKQHLKLLKQFLKESAVEGLLTKNNQPLTKEETADLYRSLKKSFIELHAANPHLFLNQSQKKDKKQEVTHLETLNSNSRQKAELYIYEPIDITKDINGKNSTSKKVHLLAVDLRHEAKIESKKEIKKRFIKEKNIDKEFLQRNEYKNMTNEVMIKENILKSIHLTSQLSRNAFKPAPSA